MKRVALAVALLIGLATPSQAGHQAAAYSRGDYATALQEYKRLAERGSAIAHRMLGVMYGKGQGVPQDYREVPELALRSANPLRRGRIGMAGKLDDMIAVP